MSCAAFYFLLTVTADVNKNINILLGIFEKLIRLVRYFNATFYAFIIILCCKYLALKSEVLPNL